jgi:hypothetical protein
MQQGQMQGRSSSTTQHTSRPHQSGSVVGGFLFLHHCRSDRASPAPGAHLQRTSDLRLQQPRTSDLRLQQPRTSDLRLQQPRTSDLRLGPRTSDLRLQCNSSDGH